MSHHGARAIVACALLSLLFLLRAGGAEPASDRPVPRQTIRWSDLAAPVQEALAAHGVAAGSFPAWVAGIAAGNERRLREGDYDHLIHYALQSANLTAQPPIEPALSAKAFVESGRIPSDARARLAAMTQALSRTPARRPSTKPLPMTAATAAAAAPTMMDDEAREARLAHFRKIAGGLKGTALQTQLEREYRRAMRFLYEKEFVAGRSAAGADAIAALYQTRGHSSDTAIEAGYGVYVALGTLRQLEPARRLARVLIVGPGLDIAPRTALLEDAAPQSYQPFAVADALRQLGLAPDAGARIETADLNPRVASAIARAVATPDLRLHAVTGIAENARVRFTDDYRAYLTSFGRAIGVDEGGATADARGRIHKTIAIAPAVRASIGAQRLDIVTQRAGAPFAGSFDLVVVTNVFPYLSDPELIVAIDNIAALLAPGGVLIHNDPRPLLQSTAAALGVPPVHARSVLIATSPGEQDYFDRVWLHVRK